MKRAGAITDGEVNTFLGALHSRPVGVDRRRLQQELGCTDRRIREIVHHLRRNAIAPVVVIRNVEDRYVYKIGSDDEIRENVAALDERIDEITAARDGLDRMRQGQYAPHQDQLFEGAPS